MKFEVAARSLVGVFLTIALVTIAFVVCAQQPASDVSNPTIRVNTRLVLVDVVVTDKKGQPITGLKPEDFILEEGSKKQKIATFTTPEDAAKAATAQSLPPGIYGNGPEYRSPGGPITVFVLDAANTPFRDQSYGRLQMLKYAQEQAKGAQRMAVFTLTNGLHAVQDFTDDPNVMMEALRRYKPQEPGLSTAGPAIVSAAVGSGDSGSPGAAPMAQALAQATNEISSFQSIQVGYIRDRRTETTLEAMRGLARVLGGMPGRKEVIWLTAAFPFDLIPEDRNISEAEAALLQQGVHATGLGTQAGGSAEETTRLSHREEIRQAAAQMSAAQIALYPVDVRGLTSGMEVTFADAGNRHATDISTVAQVKMSDVTSDQETMREMATVTGGKAYVNQNEIKDGIAIALADNGATYTLGYYPEDKKWNGKYRTLKVKVNRDGAQVRHRTGYFAIDPSQSKDRKPEQELAEALRDAVPATQVFFRAQVKPGDPGKLHVVFLVDARSLTAADASGGKKKLNVDLFSSIFSPDGKLLTNRSIKVAQDFAPEVYQQIFSQGMMVPMDVEAQAGKNNQLRLAVRDNPTGNIGTINAPLTP
jgi:VWFA-related protein